MRNKELKYHIYHHPTYQWKDGKIGKIGVTDNLKRRAREYGIESLEVLESHSSMKEVGKREMTLQKEFGYPVDRISYDKWHKSKKKAYSKESKKKRLETIKDYNWNQILKEKRTPKLDYKEIIAKRAITMEGYDWSEMLKTKRTPNMDYEAIGLKNGKQVNQYDLKGNLIKTWDTITQAKKAMNQPNDRKINQCVLGNRLTAFNFIWKYA